jgi:Ser-tRNA(Ala) deacylase AlaX
MPPDYSTNGALELESPPKMDCVAPTKLLYLDEPFRLEAEAIVLYVGPDQEGRMAVVLDRTVCHPQGGGQPSDRGRIGSADVSLEVMHCRLRDGAVEHLVSSAGRLPEAGQRVRVQVDAELRDFHSRLHSAGHLLDVAMRNIGYAYPPARGYHFPDGPYVEYEGVVPPEEREVTRRRLEAELERLVGEDFEVRFEATGERRIVTVAGDVGCLCGGTHVKNLRHLGRVRVTKIARKGGHTRVSYALEGPAPPD